MNDSIYLSIQNSPRFKELVSKRERFAWILSAIMLGLYCGFIESVFTKNRQDFGFRIGITTAPRCYQALGADALYVALLGQQNEERVRQRQLDDRIGSSVEPKHLPRRAADVISIHLFDSIAGLDGRRDTATLIIKLLRRFSCQNKRRNLS